MKKTIYTPKDDQVFNIYMKDARKHKQLSTEEEVALSEDILNGSHRAQLAVEKLVNSNLLFAIHVAKQYMGQGLDLCDLIQEANRGLVEAALKYDGRKGVRFITFANSYIKKYIVMGIQANGTQIRKPKDYHDARSKYEKLLTHTLQTEGRTPTFEEFEASAGMSHEKAMVAYMYITTSTLELDSPFGTEEGSASLGDFVISEQNADATVTRELLRQQIDSMCSSLNARNRGVLYDSFGLNTGYPLSNVEIADKYDVDVEQVRKIRARAIDNIRSHFPAAMLRAAI